MLNAATTSFYGEIKFYLTGKIQVIKLLLAHKWQAVNPVIALLAVYS